MSREINVDSGEVAVAKAPFVLRSGAIGSCVAARAENLVLPNSNVAGQGTVRGVRFSVEDNGPGIKAEHRDRIFEPFFTTRDRTKHTGLELNVGRAIAQKHGGALSLANDSDGWTRLCLDLPVTSADGETA